MVGRKLVYYGPHNIVLEDMAELPPCDAGCLLVKVEAAAVCGSDIKAFNVGNPKMMPGRTMGHEFVGVVVKADEVSGFREGDRVTMATTIGCGKCCYCAMGKSNLCPDSKAMGFFFDGALASYVTIPRIAVENGNVIRVQDDIPAEVLALCEPMSCVLNSLSRVPVEQIGSAVIIGLGALGMLHAIALREFGAKNIVCCDFPGKKKDLTGMLGFKTVVPEQLDKCYLELSDGLGFELVAITAPSNDVQAKAPKLARKGGYVSYFASLPVSDEKITISSRTLHYNELSLFGTSDSTVEHVKSAVEMIGRQKNTISELITVLPFEEVISGIDGVLDMKYAKVVVKPNA